MEIDNNAKRRIGLMTWALFMLGCVLVIGIYFYAIESPENMRYNLQPEILLLIGFPMVTISCFVCYKWIFPFIESKNLSKR